MICNGFPCDVYKGTERNRFVPSLMIEVSLNPLNSNPLLAYTRQWDKVCNTSYFRAKNAEIISYFGVFTLLETAFMQ